MNTEISYLYRDANNYKNSNTVVVKGEVQFSDIQPYLKNGDSFIPGQVDLEDLNGYDVKEDHPYHELRQDDLELTEAKPTTSLTAAQLITKFKQAYEEGWNEMPFYEEIIADVTHSGNRFLVQVPEALIHTAEFEVIMQSSEFGEETFKHFSLDLAFETILKLYAEALKLDDGVERTIGLLLNPAEKETVLTILRGHFGKNSLKVLRNDLEWACGELGIAEPQLVKNSKTGVECAFNDSNNFDILQSFLKQKELLVFRS